MVFPLNVVVYACFVSDLNRYAHAFSFFCSDAFLCRGRGCYHRTLWCIPNPTVTHITGTHINFLC